MQTDDEREFDNRETARLENEYARELYNQDIASDFDFDVEVGSRPPPVDLQPGYKWLLKHGPAPYQNDPKNGKSYFAQLQDERGEIETLWGVDIERSLIEAGVKLDDAISLSRNNRVVVDVNERQADGSILKTQKERVTWATKFQPLALAVEKKQAVAPAPAPISAAPQAAHEQSETVDRFAVLAPYWLSGLHNAEGVALAAEINKAIQAQKLAHDKEAIARLLAIQTKAGKLGLGVVPESQYLSNQDLQKNPAAPLYLLDKALVRDKEGAYRPVAGGTPVLLDKGDSVVLKSKGADAYRGAMELAAAKGWRDVELKGKPAMLAEAWLEAKLMTPPINVINYKPTEKDIEKFTARVAELSRANGIDAQETVLTVRPAAVSTGEHIGSIVAIDGDRMAQKIGRDPANVVWHDVAKLSRVPALNEMAEIKYDANGRGEVKSNVQEMSR